MGWIFGQVVGYCGGLVGGQGKDIGEASTGVIVVLWVIRIRVIHGHFAASYCSVPAPEEVGCAHLRDINVWWDE